jgi:hypothetical protein
MVTGNSLPLPSDQGVAAALSDHANHKFTGWIFVSPSRVVKQKTLSLEKMHAPPPPGGTQLRHGSNSRQKNDWLIFCFFRGEYGFLLGLEIPGDIAFKNAQQTQKAELKKHFSKICRINHETIVIIHRITGAAD